MPITHHVAKQPTELINDAIEWLSQGKQIALLTLVNIEGNAPYPVGSQMLVNADGDYLGQITGGCAEVALAEQAEIAIVQGENLLERYGLGSPYFDIKLPCGSGVDVHFDVTTPLSSYQEIQSLLDRRVPAEQIIAYGDQRLTKRYLPTEQLLVVGKGPIIGALTSLAQRSNFNVVCFENETAQTVEKYFDAHTALVSLFHEHELETNILAAAISSNLFYIGALGGKRTHRARVENLIELGCSNENVAKIHGPVGADIGAISPPQIAISILSEIIAVMNRRTH